MSKVVLYMVYLLMAIGAGCEISRNGGDVLGLGGGLIAFLILVQIHGAIVHMRARKRYEAELIALRRSGLELEMALNATRERMETLGKSLDERAENQNRRIVGELRLLESLMREQLGGVGTRTAITRRGSELKPGFMARVFEGRNDRDVLEMIRISLEENRVDLLLQPIVSLPQRKLKYYEAYSRLRTADGRVIMPKQYMGLAAPAGLMSVIDNLFLFRCVQIVRRLSRKNREVAVFCNISGETLNDADFFPQFLEYIEQNRDLKRHIVFEFSQSVLASANKDIEMRLGTLSRLGFALSVDHVENLNVDFAHMRDLGVRFLKLKAATLIDGMKTSRAPVLADDLKTYLRRNQIQLIVEHVESEKTVVQLLDFAVDYAQGFLFGEPRVVREEALRPAPAPVAKQPAPARIIPLRRAG